MTDIYKMDLLGFAKQVLTMYLWTIGIYAMISFVVYTMRYNRAVRSLRVYQMNLRRLTDMYKR